jgi:hypothetical protein
MRWLIVCVLVAACGDNTKPQVSGDAAVEPDAAAGRVKGCLDEVGIWTAPNGQLPCDLVPPGLQL